MNRFVLAAEFVEGGISPREASDRDLSDKAHVEGFQVCRQNKED
jgi:hypothetical protein